jgi:hypothetical protein
MISGGFLAPTNQRPRSSEISWGLVPLCYVCRVHQKENPLFPPYTPTPYTPTPLVLVIR